MKEKSYKIKKYSLCIVFLFVVCLMTGTLNTDSLTESSLNNFDNTETSPLDDNDTNVAETLPEDDVLPVSISNNFQEKDYATISNEILEISNKSLSIPSSAQLDLQVIYQLPELPTGCEATSLAMALQYLGFSADKTDIAENYLIYNAENMALGYLGNPFQDDGVGIFPPGLVRTANNFIRDNSDTQNYFAYDVSNKSLEQLFSYVANGKPVLLWLTVDMESPLIDEGGGVFNDKFYQWYANEHCVVMVGYNLEEETVKIYDPLLGEVDLPIDEVREIYSLCGFYAMTIT